MLQLLLRRPLLHRRRIEEDDEDPCPLDMTEELVTETLPRSCTFDQARDVGQDELPPVEAHDTQVRHESREGIVGDFGLGGRHLGDECGLPGVGEADEGRVGEQFQLEGEPFRSPVLPLLGDARSPVGGVDEGGVAPATPPALDDFDLLTLFDQVSDHCSFIVDHDGSKRDRQVQSLTGFAMSDITLAVGAVTRGVMRISLVAEQCGHRGISPEVYRPAWTSVSPDRLALGLPFGPHKRDNPRTAVAGAEVDTDPVDEHDRKLTTREGR